MLFRYPEKDSHIENKDHGDVNEVHSSNSDVRKKIVQFVTSFSKFRWADWAGAVAN